MTSYQQYSTDLDQVRSIEPATYVDGGEASCCCDTCTKLFISTLLVLCLITAVAVPMIIFITNAQSETTITKIATTATTSTTTTTTSETTTSITTTTITTATTATTSTTQSTITFSPSGIYALNIPTCATWNQTGLTTAGNQNGSLGSDLGSLSSPVSIFIDNNDVLYIADRDNNRVMKYYSNSSIGIIVAGNGTAGNDSNLLNGLKGVAIDQSGAIIVADSNNYRIQKFPAGSTIGTTLASNTSFNPLGQMRDLHIDVNNNIYITDSDYNQVAKYIPYSSIGIIMAGGSIAGSASNQLSNPFGNFVDTSGTLYVADSNNNRIMKYLSGSLNGTMVAGNSTAGSALNELSGPPAIVVDNNGYIYVADSGNARIMRWTTNYTAGGVCIIACSGVRGNAADQLRSTRDIKFDQHGNIYVTDQANHRIQKYTIQIPSSGCPSSG